jgi:hypothetical protein
MLMRLQSAARAALLIALGAAVGLVVVGVVVWVVRRVRGRW